MNLLKGWEVQETDIKKGVEIGRGTFGVVYKATLCGQVQEVENFLNCKF